MLTTSARLYRKRRAAAHGGFFPVGPLVAVAALLLFLAFAPVAAARNSVWAEPVRLPPVENLYRVTPDLYRSAQPDKAGMERLEAMGIRTVLNLRINHDDADEARSTGLILARTPMNTWSISEDEALEALAILRAAQKPLLVHCMHGSDRTGLVIALYRMVEQGWSKEQAMDEMMNGGYGFHAVWKNIPRFIEKADIVTLRNWLDGSTAVPPAAPAPASLPGASHP